MRRNKTNNFEKYLAIILTITLVIAIVGLMGTVFDVDKKPASTTQKPTVEDNNSGVIRTDHETVVYCYNNNYRWFYGYETWHAYVIDQTGVNEPILIMGENMSEYMNDNDGIDIFVIPAGYTHIMFGDAYSDEDDNMEFYENTRTEFMPIVENENKCYFPEFDIWFELIVIKQCPDLM